MDLKELRRLIRLVEGTQISELEIRREGSTIRIVRTLCPPAQSVVPPGSAPVFFTSSVMPSAAVSLPSSALPPVAGKDDLPNLVAITSPMIGTFYRSIAPEAEVFVNVGDIIEKGQVVCIIEAMKLMNEIDADISGRIVRIMKENATPVEFGEELFLIEPI